MFTFIFVFPSDRHLHMDEFLGTDQAVISNERPARGFNTPLSVSRQRQVGNAGVAAIERPFSLAVTDDEAARGHGGHKACNLGKDRRNKKLEQDSR